MELIRFLNEKVLLCWGGGTTPRSKEDWREFVPTGEKLGKRQKRVGPISVAASGGVTCSSRGGKVARMRGLVDARLLREELSLRY